MQIIHHKIKFVVCFFLVAVFLSACKKDSSTTNTTSNINNLIENDATLSLFNYAVTKTGLDVYTKGPGPFTFFVPTNDAFSKAGITSNTDFDKFSNADLALILSSHFTGDNISYLLLPKGPNATLTAQNSLTNYISKYDSTGAFINGVKLLDEGTAAQNGMVYKIDEVLPVTYNGTTNINYLTMAGFSLMVQGISKANIASSFTTNPSTIFAIPNSVMIANGYDSTKIAGLSGTALTTLSNLLRYHSLPLRIFKSDFSTGTFPTRYTGNSVNIINNNQSITIKGKNNSSNISVQPLKLVNSSTNLIQYGITSSGVIYTINEMLKP